MAKDRRPISALTDFEDTYSIRCREDGTTVAIDNRTGAVVETFASVKNGEKWIARSNREPALKWLVQHSLHSQGYLRSCFCQLRDTVASRMGIEFSTGRCLRRYLPHLEKSLPDYLASPYWQTAIDDLHNGLKVFGERIDALREFAKCDRSFNVFLGNLLNPKWAKYGTMNLPLDGPTRLSIEAIEKLMSEVPGLRLSIVEAARARVTIRMQSLAPGVISGGSRFGAVSGRKLRSPQDLLGCSALYKAGRSVSEINWHDVASEATSGLSCFVRAARAAAASLSSDLSRNSDNLLLNRVPVLCLLLLIYDRAHRKFAEGRLFFGGSAWQHLNKIIDTIVLAKDRQKSARMFDPHTMREPSDHATGPHIVMTGQTRKPGSHRDQRGHT